MSIVLVCSFEYFWGFFIVVLTFCRGKMGLGSVEWWGRWSGWLVWVVGGISDDVVLFSCSCGWSSFSRCLLCWFVVWVFLRFLFCCLDVW